MNYLKYTFWLILFFSTSLSAQQDQYHFRIGLHYGAMSYYGDLVDQFRIIQPTPENRAFFSDLGFDNYGVSLEKKLSPSWSVGLLYNTGSFTANDRATDWDGNLRKENPNFERSLNVKTDINSFSLFFTLHTDNDRLFSREAFLSPYLRFGAGLTQFETFADQYVGQSGGQRYYYWPDGSIRNLAENDPNAENAMLIEQDGEYETALNTRNLEGEDYPTTVFTPMAGLGLKFRLFDRLNLNVEYLTFMPMTDFLDDVSGDFRERYENDMDAYLANPNDIAGQSRGNQNGDFDFYHFAQVSLHFNFGFDSKSFTAPIIRTNSQKYLQSPEASTNSGYEGPELEVMEVDTFLRIEPTFSEQITDPETSFLTVENEETQKVDTLQQTVMMDSSKVMEVEQTMVSQEAEKHEAKLLELVIRDTVSSVNLMTDTIVQRDRAEMDRPDVADSLLVTETDARSVPIAPRENEQEKATVETASGAVTTMEPTADTLLEKVVEREIRIEQDTAVAEEIARLQAELDQLKSSQQTEMQQLRKEINEVLLQLQTQDAEQQKIYLQKLNEVQQKMGNSESDPQTTPVQIEQAPTNNEALMAVEEELSALRQSLQSQDKDSEIKALRQRIAELESGQANPTIVQPANNQGIENQLSDLQRELASLRNQPAPSPQRPSVSEAQLLALQTQLTGLNQKISALQTQEAQSPQADSSALKNLQAEIQALRLQMADINPMGPQPPEKPSPAEDSKDLQKQLLELQAQLATMNERQKTADLRAEAEQKEAQQAAEIKQLQEEIARMKAAKIADESSLDPKTENDDLLQRKIRGKEEQNIFFPVGSAQLNATATATLNNLVELLRMHDRLDLRLQGFTDPSGNATRNLQLAQRRAQSAIDYLIAQGVPPTQLKQISGQIDPAPVNPSFGRRVTLRLQIIDAN